MIYLIKLTIILCLISNISIASSRLACDYYPEVIESAAEKINELRAKYEGGKHDKNKSEICDIYATAVISTLEDLQQTLLDEHPHFLSSSRSVRWKAPFPLLARDSLGYENVLTIVYAIHENELQHDPLKNYPELQWTNENLNTLFDIAEEQLRLIALEYLDLRKRALFFIMKQMDKELKLAGCSIFDMNEVDTYVNKHYPNLNSYEKIQLFQAIKELSHGRIIPIDGSKNGIFALVAYLQHELEYRLIQTRMDPVTPNNVRLLNQMQNKSRELFYQATQSGDTWAKLIPKLQFSLLDEFKVHEYM